MNLPGLTIGEGEFENCPIGIALGKFIPTSGGGIAIENISRNN